MAGGGSSCHGARVVRDADSTEETAIYPLGRLRGLRACASDRGTFVLLALDHRQNLRKEMSPADPGSVTTEAMIAFKQAVVRALAPATSGVLLDPEIGVAQCIVDGSLPARSGLLVAVEATGYTGTPYARVTSTLPGWSVAQAKRIGASAVKLLVYYHPEAANAADQERLVERVAREAMAEDIPLFLEPLSFSIDPNGGSLRGEERREVVVATARRLTGIGGDILKAEFPYDPSVSDEALWREACAEVDAASRVPWVLLSGGVDGPTFEAQASVACESGASGVLVGRSVWADAATMAEAERDTFLSIVAVARLHRLSAIVDQSGRSWESRSPILRDLQAPPSDWYRQP